MSIFVQLLLAFVVTILTFLMAFVSIQVFHILHEFRGMLKRVNRILEHTNTLSEAAARPVTAVNDFYAEVKELVDVTQDQLIAATPDRVITPKTKTPASGHVTRLFRRAGLPIRPS
jgi:uncharacterized protein YoxC